MGDLVSDKQKKTGKRRMKKDGSHYMAIIGLKIMEPYLDMKNYSDITKKRRKYQNCQLKILFYPDSSFSPARFILSISFLLKQELFSSTLYQVSSYPIALNT